MYTEGLRSRNVMLMRWLQVQASVEALGWDDDDARAQTS
jgi:hypothetical protein